MVNNAGIIRMASFHKMMPKDWEDVINVHLNGSFYVARAAAPHMREQKSGAFVHMASTAGLVGTLGMANYAAAKIGIHGLSRSIAIDMGVFNVRSNAIAPAAHSRMIDATPNQTPEMAARIERRQRVQKPEHIANLTVFLLSDAAQGHQRPDFRRTRSGDLSLQPAAAGAHAVPLRRLAAAEARRAAAADAEELADAAGAHGRRVQLGCG